MTVSDDKLAAVSQGMLHSWWADRIPDRLALISPHGDRTFADLNAEINRLSRALRSRGLQPGDAIALMCTNEPAFLEVLYAAQRTGLRLTPINWHLTGEEAAYIIAELRGEGVRLLGHLRRRGRGRRGGRRPGPGQDQHGRLHPRLRDVQHRGGRRGRLRHRGSRSSAPRCSTRRHHRPAQGRPPRERRGERTGHRQLLRVRRGLRDQRRRPPPHRSALPRRPAGLLGRGPPRLRRPAGGHGPLGPRRGAPPDRAARHHAHAHGPDHVPPPARAPGRDAHQLRHLVAPLRDPRCGPLPRPGQAAPDRVARSRGGRVLRRHRGPGHPRRLRRPGWPTPGPSAGPWSPAWSRWPTRPATTCRRARSAWSSCRRRPPRSSTTTATRRRRPAPSAATTSRWATWATWTPKDSST